MEQVRHTVAVSLYDPDKVYLKANRIDRSKFLRQAVAAHKAGKFKYDPFSN